MPIFETSNIEFVSLQKELCESDAQILAQDPRIADLGSHFSDFSDTAAVMEHLDLVIAVDTSVAHLAGALGKPVWILLPFCSDWRWLIDRNDSPWYPTMRLFRQPAIDDWDSVIIRLSGALAELAGAAAIGAKTVLSPSDDGDNPNLCMRTKRDSSGWNPISGLPLRPADYMIRTMRPDQ
jgi:Glycosyltransferase family 9 (heptosyltransferase)